MFDFAERREFSYLVNGTSLFEIYSSKRFDLLIVVIERKNV